MIRAVDGRILSDEKSPHFREAGLSGIHKLNRPEKNPSGSILRSFLYRLPIQRRPHIAQELVCRLRHIALLLAHPVDHVVDLFELFHIRALGRQSFLVFDGELILNRLLSVGGL